MIDPEVDELVEPIIEKPSMNDRIRRDSFARKRRSKVKEIKAIHQWKEEKDARERLRAKRRLEKEKRRKLQKSG